MEQLIQVIAIAAIPILFAITLHEAAHGYVARHFGEARAVLPISELRNRPPSRTMRYSAGLRASFEK